MSSNRGVLLAVAAVVLGFGLLVLMAVDAQALPGVEVGPSRQVIHRGVPTSIYVANFKGKDPEKVTTSLVAAVVSPTGDVSWVDAPDLPLVVSPSTFTLKNDKQHHITVEQTGPIAQPLVGVSFTFEPQTPDKSMLLISNFVAELTVHPHNPIFTQPLAPTPHHSSLYWLPLGLLLLAVLGTVDFVRRKLRSRKQRPHKGKKKLAVATSMWQ